MSDLDAIKARAEDWYRLGISPRGTRDDIRALLAEVEKWRSLVGELVAACDAALEWSAGYPLGIASTWADKEAAVDVYNKCSATRQSKGDAR